MSLKMVIYIYILLTAREYSINNKGVPGQKFALLSVPQFGEKLGNHYYIQWQSDQNVAAQQQTNAMPDFPPVAATVKKKKLVRKTMALSGSPLVL